MTARLPHALFAVLALALMIAAGCRPPQYAEGEPHDAGYSSDAAQDAYSPHAPPPSGTTRTTEPAMPSTVQRAPSESGAPELEVINRYTVPQYVFIDGEYYGSVPVDMGVVFLVDEGLHTVVCADSPEISHNPVSVTEPVSVGERLVVTVFTDPE